MIQRSHKQHSAVGVQGEEQISLTPFFFLFHLALLPLFLNTSIFPPPAGFLFHLAGPQF